MGDDFDISELRNVLKELEEFRSSSLHEIGNFHSQYSSKIKFQMDDFSKSFDDLIKLKTNGVKGVDEAIEMLNNDVKVFLNQVEINLQNGIIIL